MSTAQTVAALLALGVAAGVLRSLDGAHRLARAALQAGLGLAIWLALFPPPLRTAGDSGELVVLAPGATEVQIGALAAGATTVALPGAPAPRGTERVPDLGTALRRHGEATRIAVIGAGLSARDRDVARGRVVRFDAAALPPGIAELDAPALVAAGRMLRIGGRIEGIESARIELRDPAGALAAQATPEADGRFAFEIAAKTPGTALHALRVLDRDGAVRDEVAVPVAAVAGRPLRVLIVAGAPDAELKYLRRWASDAGIALRSRIALSEGIFARQGAFALDAATLADSDLVLVDERGWAALSASERAALDAAVREGLGLLLRATALPGSQVVADWAALGFALRADDGGPVRLPASQGDAAPPALARAPVVATAGDAAPLLRADDGRVLAAWRAHGRGRVGVVTLADSFRLALGGSAARHGTLWSDIFAGVARAGGSAWPVLPREARVGERAVFCGLAPDARVEAKGANIALAADPSTPGCAAYWPRTAGWQTLTSDGTRWPFHVRATDEATTLAQASDRDATRALVGGVEAPAQAQVREVPRARWPFLLAAALLAAALWWLERRTRERAARA